MKSTLICVLVLVSALAALLLATNEASASTDSSIQSLKEILKEMLAEVNAEAPTVTSPQCGMCSACAGEVRLWGGQPYINGLDPKANGFPTCGAMFKGKVRATIQKVDCMYYCDPVRGWTVADNTDPAACYAPKK